MDQPKTAYSWSDRLFLRVNRLVGISPVRDSIMYFCAHWLLYVHAVLICGWAVLTLLPQSETLFWHFFLLLGAALVFSFIISYGIAVIWRHDRPMVEHPQIKALLTPTFRWKSFPSDHTITITVLIATLFIFSPSLWFFLPLFVLGVCIPIGRVYVGVHYPRDILGGLTIGILCTMVAYRLLL